MTALCDSTTVQTNTNTLSRKSIDPSIELTTAQDTTHINNYSSSLSSNNQELTGDLFTKANDIITRY